MREGEQTDHGLASRFLSALGEQHVESTRIGAPGKELVAVDEVEQRHGLSAQRMNDVPIIDDMSVLPVGPRPPARQIEQMRRPLKDLEPIVVKMYEELMADQPRGHCVEDFTEGEGAGRGDRDPFFLEVRCLARR